MVIVGAVTGFGAALSGLCALILWPTDITTSMAFVSIAAVLVAVSLTLWAVHKEWIK